MRHPQNRPGSGPPTLGQQPVGTAVELLDLGADPMRARRLRALGLRPGQTLVVTHVRRGGLVVACDAGRVAVGPEIANDLHVKAVA